MLSNTAEVTLWIKVSEGGFVDNPRDPGGATNMGVTLRELAAYRGHSVTVHDVQDLTWAEAKTILVAQYMDPVHFNDLPSGLDYCVADESFNSGPTKAIKMLQQIVHTEADGHYGLLTAAAVRGINDREGAVEAYDKARLGFLRHLPTWAYFGNGWLNRVNLVSSRAKIMAARPAA